MEIFVIWSRRIIWKSAAIVGIWAFLEYGDSRKVVNLKDCVRLIPQDSTKKKGGKRWNFKLKEKDKPKPRENGLWGEKALSY